ncbi:MAG: DEAD/DEAH box helicase [Gemmatimonadales bacterium]|nr:MAG: DEAD/DEAH box helicase [Gemmatimonadales bacterium]
MGRCALAGGGDHPPGQLPPQVLLRVRRRWSGDVPDFMARLKEGSPPSRIVSWLAHPIRQLYVAATPFHPRSPVQGNPVPPSPQLEFRNGLAILRHTPDAPGWMAWDERIEAWVAAGWRLPELRRWAAEQGIEAAPQDPDVLDHSFHDTRTPREYQREALHRWEGSGGRGSVVLPTGTGKTLIALLAIRSQARGTLVIAPTRALLSQWFIQLADAFGVHQVGVYYGEEKDVRRITVTTYHSAFQVLEREGHRFELLVLDEVHHLADTRDGDPRAWHDALRVAPASRRLGLTATYPAGAATELERLVGPVVYRRTIGEMADRELASFVTERRFVSLDPDEEARYQSAEQTYRSFVEAQEYRDRADQLGAGEAEWWPLFMAETRRSPAARRAFRAFRERERIVALAEGKLREVGRILRMHPAEQALVFCGSRAAAEKVSRRFAIPMVTAGTPAGERRDLLHAMDEGTIRALASIQVLDEGWDVPGAKLGIILGDTSRGGKRQHAQRLGRILRRQGDQVASLYEVVAAGTFEFFASQKRKSAASQVRERQLGLGL